MRVRGTAIALLCLAGCVITTEVPLPENAVRFTSPAQYAVWWRVTQECAGLTGDYASIAWYVVPDGELVPGDDSVVGTTWGGDAPRIVLTQGVLSDGRVVRHEMLHVLVGTHLKHPAEFFRERCGDIVNCEGDCAREAGVWAQPSIDSPVVEPRTLTLTLASTPNPVSRMADSGLMAVVVTARNPAPYPVWVRIGNLTGFGAANKGGFWWSSPAFGGAATFTGDSLTSFDAGQTRRFVFDAKAYFSLPMEVPVGRYPLTGGFSSASANAVQFEVIP